MRDLLFSVIVPTYNRRDILESCLKSLVAQTYSHVEIVVVDDCSTDNTVEFLAEFAEAHPDCDLQWLVNEENQGVGASRNAGIKAAKGDVIALIDSDAVAEPDWLERLAPEFTDDTVGSVSGLILEEEPRNIYERALKGVSRVGSGGDARRIATGNVALRRELALRFPFEKEVKHFVHGEDDALGLRLKAAGFRLRMVAEAVVHHIHPYGRRDFFRRAWHNGVGAAWLVHKFYLPPRLDLLPFFLAYGTLPLGFIGVEWLLVPAVFFAAALAALFYNEVCRKGKSVGEALICMPLILAYYQVRIVAYVTQKVRFLFGVDRVQRERLSASRGTS